MRRVRPVAGLKINDECISDIVDTSVVTSNVTIGIYTICVASVDNDGDRTDDAEANTNYFDCLVVDDDAKAPAGPSENIVVCDRFQDGLRANGTDDLDVDWFLQSSNIFSRPLDDSQKSLGNYTALRLSAQDEAAIVAPFSTKTIDTTTIVRLRFMLRADSVAQAASSGFRAGLYHDNGSTVSAAQDESGARASTNDSGYVVAFDQFDQSRAATQHTAIRSSDGCGSVRREFAGAERARLELGPGDTAGADPGMVRHARRTKEMESGERRISILSRKYRGP